MSNQIFVIIDDDHGVLGAISGGENLQMGIQSCVLALSARYPDRQSFELSIETLTGDEEGVLFTSPQPPKKVLFVRAPDEVVKEFLSENNIDESQQVRDVVDKKDLN